MFWHRVLWSETIIYYGYNRYLLTMILPRLSVYGSGVSTCHRFSFLSFIWDIAGVSCSTQTSRKLAALVSDTTLFFDKGRSGSLSQVFSSTKEVASCKMSM